MEDIDLVREVAITAARRAGALQMAAYLERQPLTVEFKDGAVGSDPVTNVDKRCEAEIIRIIRSHFPGHSILAEESLSSEGNRAFRWIVDPLDGTVNYSHRYPCFGCSLAFESEGEVVLGVVYDAVLDHLYVAERGGGAHCNGERLRVSDERELSRALLITGFPYDLKLSPDRQFDYFIAFTMRSQGVRRDGSAALDLGRIAAGRCDGFWEKSLFPWDVAAGLLLVREAGGKVTTFDGTPYQLGQNSIIASNGHLHSAMEAVIRQVNEGKPPFLST